jgi:hypothetical protein
VRLRWWRRLIGPIMGLVVLGAPAAALSPSDSIILLKPGSARTGTLHHGVFTGKGQFSLSGVSLAAASRSSLALYTKSTGRLRTGTFRFGTYDPVEHTFVRSGFTHIAASCDSLILYRRATGRALVGTLEGGRFRNRHSLVLAAGYDRIAATCTGLLLWDVDTGPMDVYTLKDGEVVERSSTSTTVFGIPVHLATTTDSYMALFPAFTPSGLAGVWGRLRPKAEPALQNQSDSTDFMTWQIIAGTATSLLFYNADGAACRWWLAAGEIEASSCDGPLQAGWTVIAGGK